MEIVDLVNNKESIFMASLLTEVWVPQNLLKINEYYSEKVVIHFQDEILDINSLRQKVSNSHSYKRLEIRIKSALSIYDLLIAQLTHIGFDGEKQKFFWIQATIIHRIEMDKVIEVWLPSDTFSAYESSYYDAQIINLEKEIASSFINKVIPTPLSKRELECLLLVLEGKGAKEIALIFKISHRTVESYIEKIKIKLNCQTKYEIMEKLRPIGLWAN